MHICHLSAFAWTGISLVILCLAAYLIHGDTWRRVFNRPKRLIVPVTKEEIDQ